MSSRGYELTSNFESGTPCEVTGIVEHVSKKQKINGKWTDSYFEVIAPRSQTKFKCTYSGFALISEEDRVYITGVRTPTSEPKVFNMIVNSQPIIEPGATRSAVLGVLVSAFPRRSKLTEIVADDIFNAIEVATRDQEGDDVDRVILHLSTVSNLVNNRYDFDVSKSPIYNIVDKETIIAIYKFWFKNREKRKLQMLGLMPDEIDALPWDTHISYEKIRNNPYTVPMLSLERCLVMMKSIKRMPTQEQVRRGEILREIYKACNERSWSYYPYKFLTENFPDFWEHNEPLVADRDPDGNTPHGYGLFTDDEVKGVYLKHFHKVEEGMADMLAKRVEDNDSAVESKFKIEPFFKMSSLSDDQKSAITGVINNPISVLTGGPGTGKTTCIMEIVNNYIAHNIDFVICSFTGKAVARVKEVLKINAFSDDIIELSTCTLHRGIHRGLDKEKVTNLIIDETSMVTTELFYKFLSIFPDIKWITMVGDYNQLLPISWGSLFKEIIFSERFPVFRLYVNHRVQKVDGETDGITLNAERMVICSREYVFSFEEYNNFRIVKGNDKTVQALVKKLVESQQIRDHEIIVLTPRNEEQRNLNQVLSQFYRPKAEMLKDSKGNHWRIGDLVIATENIYGSINIMNGTPGRIIEFHTSVGNYGKNIRKLRISFDKDSVENWDPKEPIAKFRRKSHFFDTTIPKRNPYGGSENQKVDDNVALHVGMISRACSLTVHKSQGSEWPYVIVYLPPDIKASKSFLNRNLIYTAITRAKKMCILIGDEEVANLAANTKPAYRAEALAMRLASKLNKVYKRPSMYDEEGDVEHEDLLVDDDPYDEPDYIDDDIYDDDVDDYDDYSDS